MLELIEVTKETVDDDLVTYLTNIFNTEIIDTGTTYPHTAHMTPSEFKDYWFNDAIVLVSGRTGNWENDLCGTYYIKAQYPGRCAHICNAGFIVPRAKRGMQCMISTRY